MKPFRSVSISLVACLSASSALSQTPVHHVLPGGYTPTAVSGDGAVVVGDNGNTGQYFEWTAGGGPSDIGGATAGNGVGGQATISQDGTMVGGSAFNAGSSLYEMSIYDRGTTTWTHLGGIGSSSGSSASSGWGISGDGDHVVGLGWVNAGEAHAIQWSSGGSTVDLGSSVLGESSRANGCDFDGDVVCGWQDGSGRNGAVWINGVQTVITAEGGGFVGEAGAVSADGNWVVGIGASSTSNEAWRWSAGGGVEPLGSLGLGGFPPPRGFATAVNGDGSVIVGFDRGFGPATSGEGWIWTSGTGLVSLDDYLADLGLVVQDNLRFALPLGISADGKTIVGLGRSDTAFTTGFVLTLDDDCDFPTRYCASNANSSGSAATISVSGSPSVSLNNLVLHGEDLPANRNGQFFYGPGQIQAPFGPGFLCVSAPQFRLGVVTSDGSGDVSHALDITAQSLPAGIITPGSTWNFQLWFRDSNGDGFNSTDAVSVPFCD